MTYKGIKRETTRGLTFDTRQVMSLLNDKVKKNSIIFQLEFPKSKNYTIFVFVPLRTTRSWWNW